ncbi:holo-ACP synthase [Streptomyces sp. NPDC057702]|uniref:holo-ACP synthase n=1 Tax=unclassified Streptomyces TaxID=2593676 RepID=UPI003674B966
MPSSPVPARTLSTGFDLQSVAELRDRPRLRHSSALFSPGERAHCHTRPDPNVWLTGVLSAKEAFVKAAGSLGGAPGHSFREIEVVYGDAGVPRLHLHGEIARWCQERSITIDVSISHTGDMAGAVVVLLAGERVGP